jgi:hypothetical protein
VVVWRGGRWNIPDGQVRPMDKVWMSQRKQFQETACTTEVKQHEVFTS